MCSLFICNSCKPFIVVNPNITGIQGWDFLRQADISPGMWCSVLIMLLWIIRCWMKSKYCWMQTHTYTHTHIHTHTHTHKCTFQNFPHFPIFPFSSIFSNLLELWILQPHESSSQLILQGAELFLPSPAQTEDPTEKGSVVFKLLSYKVVCYTASDY